MRISHIITEQSLPLILRPICVRTPTQTLVQYNFSTTTKTCSLLELFGRGEGRGRRVLNNEFYSEFLFNSFYPVSLIISPSLFLFPVLIHMMGDHTLV